MTIHEILKNHWGFDRFRPLQEDIIMSALEGRDSLALLPTGGGKSICFQVPAMAMEGLCLVISPLIALMKDQVENLQKKGIEAAAIYSGMGRREMDVILNNCIFGKYKFLYLSPERLVTDYIREKIAQMEVCLLAVDEAHCISQWGYDFRPEYLRIAEIRDLKPQLPVLALTATATARVVTDIKEKLRFRKANVFKKSFKRDNLSYVSFNEEDKQGKILHILKKVGGSGVIYVRNRKSTQDLAVFLQRNGIRADYYHAGLNNKLRTEKQDLWIKGRTRIMVCTNAFGMGIDKPDVRTVIHYEIPESLEAYYQEAGRAGRDENRSYCVLLYNETDLQEARNRMEAGFPPVEEIKRVYQALGNYFSLAVGAGEGISFDFNLADFSKKFNFKPLTAYNAIKILEREGILTANDSFHSPSRIMFLINHTDLYDFQLKQPKFDGFIKILLRSYGGVFDNYVAIRESEIAKRAKIQESVVIKGLQTLHRIKALDYQPKKDSPQIVFNSPRADHQSIPLDIKLLNSLKEISFEKLEAVIDYARNTEICRSNVLLAYFDETGEEKCGTCDICIEWNKKNNPETLDSGLYSSRLKSILEAEPKTAGELIEEFGSLHEKQLLETIKWLMDNDKIAYNEKQQLIWKN